MCGKVEQSEKPRKRHRVKAYQFLRRLDNALQFHTGGGLARYQVQPADLMAVDSSWIEWPRLSITADRGSDVVSAMHFCQRRLLLNVDYLPDASHDYWNALRECLEEFVV